MALLLTSGNPLGLRALGSGGRTAITSYEQINRTLRQSLDAEHATLFSEPNRRATTIDWFANVDGDAVRLADAPDDRKQHGLARLEQLVRDIEAKAASLQKSDRQDERILGDMLAHALEIPEERAVFLVGEQPVMTFWGFVKDQGRPATAPLRSLLGQRTSAPGRPASVPPRETATPATQPPMSQIVSTPRADRSWLVPAILWSVLSLLLLTCGIELLRSCAIGLPYPLTGWILNYCPNTLDPDTAAVLAAERAKQDQLRSEYDDLVRQASLKRQACVIKADDARKVTPIASPKPDPVDETKMKIPEKKTDLEFLAGCWRAHPGIFETRDGKETGKKLVLTYCFDGNGSGTRTIRFEEDDARCVGGAQAHFNGEVLAIDFAESICEKGHGKFDPALDRCKRADNGDAKCDETSPTSTKPNFTDFPFTRTTEQP